MYQINVDYNKTEFIKINMRGKSFYVKKGRYDYFWKRIANNQWEPNTYEIFDKFIDCRHSYIGIGAWIGPTILYGCQDAKIAYGIEANPVAYEELLSNVCLNENLKERIRLFNICIAPKSGKIAFGNREKGGDSMSSILFGEYKTAWMADGVTFDSIVKENDITDCNFIKMDIEGGEYLIVPTMKSYLNKSRPTLYLSLHPCLLGNLKKPGLVYGLLRIFARFANTSRIIMSTMCYKNLYNEHGVKIGRFHLLYKCLRCTRLSIIFTDKNWVSK